uniref:Uncharacterized protein n=1 Tax=Acrobeloides nanus TaxID=290746 RepID=A0A914D7B0_9BILA
MNLNASIGESKCSFFGSGVNCRTEATGTEFSSSLANNSCFALAPSPAENSGIGYALLPLPIYPQFLESARLLDASRFLVTVHFWEVDLQQYRIQTIRNSST